MPVAAGQLALRTAQCTARQVYFQDGGRRTVNLEDARFTDVEHIEFDL